MRTSGQVLSRAITSTIYHVAISWEAVQAGMSCVDITNEMATLLVALRLWPDVDVEALRVLPEWKVAQDGAGLLTPVS
jgi:hypothetical protein